MANNQSTDAMRAVIAALDKREERLLTTAYELDRCASQLLTLLDGLARDLQRVREIFGGKAGAQDG